MPCARATSHDAARSLSLRSLRSHCSLSMQSPTFLPLDARDHYPACLRLAWLAVPVATETLDLYLTWHFGS
ncbi:MAG: hypothetical protein HC838_02760, partial [Spirulinaceae cyanobacterium RM2_2_10]|nr:hypothetical protein [Spirulinaceae cyanobacterium RM2_2_10]